MSPVTSPLQARHSFYVLFYTQKVQYRALHSGSTHSSGQFTISNLMSEWINLLWQNPQLKSVLNCSMGGLASLKISNPSEL
jgi:hypothetical protein